MNRERCAVCWLVAVLGLMLAQAVSAGVAADRLHDAYRFLVEADALVRAGSTNRVAALYRDAINELEDLQRQYPGWQHEVIAARLAYARNRWVGFERAMADSRDAQTDAMASEVVRSLHEQRVLDELAWREKLARVQAELTALRHETMELKSRLRASRDLPSPSPPRIPATLRDRLGRIWVEESDRLFDEAADPDAAIELLEAGRALQPSDQTIALALGLAYCRMGRFNEGARILRNVRRAQPENVEARLALGAAWMGLGNPGSARVEIEAALMLEPDNPDAHYNMASLLLMIPDGDLALARRHYMQSVALGGAPDGEIEQVIQRKALQQIGRRR